MGYKSLLRFFTAILLFTLCATNAFAQVKVVNPTILYSGAPQK